MAASGGTEWGELSSLFSFLDAVKLIAEEEVVVEVVELTLHLPSQPAKSYKANRRHNTHTMTDLFKAVRKTQIYLSNYKHAN